MYEVYDINKRINIFSKKQKDVKASHTSITTLSSDRVRWQN